MFKWEVKTHQAKNAIYIEKEVEGKGRFFRARFLQAGLVNYSFGVCLLNQESIMRFAESFVGCPVVIDHKDVTEESAKEDRVGVISKVDFDNYDGWFWCEGIIFDDKAIELVNNGYNVSCQYEITEYAKNIDGKLHNGNNYDIEILNGRPEHLAIVENPRYENAMIAVNAICANENEEHLIDKADIFDEYFDNEEIENPIDNSILENIYNLLKAKNEGGWITVKPNGDDKKGRHLYLEDGETVKEAAQRQWGEKRKKEEEKKEDIKIKKETQKAFLLNKEGVEFWVQKRWYKDGKLTSAGQKAFEKTKKEKRQIEYYKKHGVNFKKSWESDKAIGVDLVLDFFDMEKTKTHRVFVPKSMLKENGNVPYWIYERKIKEIYEQYPFSQYGGFDIMESGFDEKKAENSTKNEIFTIKDGKIIKIDDNYIPDFKELEDNINVDTLKGDNKMETTNGILEKIFNLLAKNEADKKEDKEDENKCKNEDTDKRKLIDEVGGILKGKVDEEVWRTIIGKIEKVAYSKSEDGTADNKVKNEDVEDEKKCSKEADNECKNNENEKEKEKEYEDLKEQIRKDIENEKAKNSLGDARRKIYGAKVEKTTSHITQKQALELGKKLY